jgi:predicted nucleic acid-binding protein
MAEALCLVDSNILIRWIDANSSECSDITAALDVLVHHRFRLCYTSQNLGEFWNACTRPLARNGLGLSPNEADRKASFFEARLRLLPDGVLVHEEWRKLLVEHGVSGVQVHDTRLVAVMNVYGVTQLLTYNTKDFARFKYVRAMLPKEVLSAL